MRPRATLLALLAALAVLLLAPSAAQARDRLVLAAELGEDYAYLAPWSKAEPLTEVRLRAFAIDGDVDYGLGIGLGRPWGGDLPGGGAMNVDFTVRVHDDLESDENFEPFFAVGPVYSHLWAEQPQEDAPTSWTTREAFGLRVGGGFLLTSGAFYFDMTAYGIAELVWPEPSYVAGGGLDLAFGLYLS